MHEKKKVITIKEEEGHGQMDGMMKGERLSNIQVCRFKFPRYPMDETRLIQSVSQDADEQCLNEMKKDLNKIIKFLIRQTFEEKGSNKGFSRLKDMTFFEFLYEVGMVRENKFYEYLTDEEKAAAKSRYLKALSVSVQGSATIHLKREVKDIFINGYNKAVMEVFKSNMDMQIVIDPYAAAQYILNYLTKNEAGNSKLLKAIDQETLGLSQIERLNAFARVLDKHRECSLQEAIYRLLGLQMTRSSRKVKYVSTIHPHYRDGLLKGNLEDLDENESIFHISIHQYYECRPISSTEEDEINYVEEELEQNYWDNVCLAEFCSKYEIDYGQKPLNLSKKTNLIPLINNKGYIRRRSEMAVLRYYLTYENDEDIARGLLILFLPFRCEMSDIHFKDVKQLLAENLDSVEEKRSIFEKYKLMSDLISKINSDIAASGDAEENVEEAEEIETTGINDIEQFNKWAKSQAVKDLSKFKSFTSVTNIEDLRTSISSLNYQQRRLFDDITERCASYDVNERPFYLFLSGNAGTGKSFLVRILIDAVKLIKIKSGDDLQKPHVLVMAPTAVAAYIIGGKTIDSVLGFSPTEGNKYTQANPGKMAMMKH